MFDHSIPFPYFFHSTVDDGFDRGQIKFVVGAAYWAKNKNKIVQKHRNFFSKYIKGSKTREVHFTKFIREIELFILNFMSIFWLFYIGKKTREIQFHENLLL